MPKQPYVTITPEGIHQVATLTAAGVRPNAIWLRTGFSPYVIRRLMTDPSWEGILATKTAQFEAMMRGDA